MKKCSPFENLTNVHEWLCQRAGPDRIATYRVEEVLPDLNVTKPVVTQSLRRLCHYGAIENISRARVCRMLVRVDLIHPIFNKETWETMVKKAAYRVSTQPYRPIPEYTGYRDPYQCAVPMLAYFRANADVNGVCAFNFDEIAHFGTHAVILAALNVLAVKKKIIPMRPMNTVEPKNYTVKVLEA